MTDSGLTRSEVMNLFGGRIGRWLLGAGFSSISARGGRAKQELTDIPGIGASSADTILESLLPGLTEEPDEEEATEEAAATLEPDEDEEPADSPEEAQDEDEDVPAEVGGETPEEGTGAAETEEGADEAVSGLVVEEIEGTEEETEVEVDYYDVQLSPGRMLGLPKIAMPSGVTIAFFQMLGDPYLTRECAGLLVEKFGRRMRDTILVTPEAKSIPMVHEMAALLDTEYVVLRKENKPYMGLGTYEAPVRSITSGQLNVLYLGEDDAELIRGKAVSIVDDVISTGQTLAAMRALMAMVGAIVKAEVAVFIEGDDAPGGVQYLARLPVW